MGNGHNSGGLRPNFGHKPFNGSNYKGNNNYRSNGGYKGKNNCGGSYGFQNRNSRQNGSCICLETLKIGPMR